MKATIRKFSSNFIPHNYHKVLGVKFGADKKEVRAAYLSLAKKYHPDAPTGNTEKFKLIAEAYEVLSDPSLAHTVKPSKDQGSSNEFKENFHSSDHENFEKAYEDWVNAKNFSYASRHENLKAHGYVYYDPYLKETERYTYSKFKRDKFNMKYKDPAKQKSQESYESDFDKKQRGSLFSTSAIAIFMTLTLNLFVKPLA
ncbi:hypothetical protein SteCoe_2682 [Stentor coeruleus]|uniref:J domain-containing protein n=1 Tax=Stentor coeruleus TaxID=5963 RepID=A0A1R2CYY1_9CILI|nr:hypothetical protein SteCoe_2682 [Stentor coeruleus]